jgi:hypothetical protein
MNKVNILNSLDAEIQRLQRARDLLSDEPSSGKRAAVMNRTLGRKRRRMSAEARAKIAAAQKKRWAALKSAKKK